MDSQSKTNLRLVSPQWSAILDMYFLRYNGILSDFSLPFILSTTVNLHSVTAQNFLLQPAKKRGSRGRTVSVRNSNNRSIREARFRYRDKMSSSKSSHKDDDYVDDSDYDLDVVSVSPSLNNQNWNKNNSGYYKIPTKKLIFQQQDCMRTRWPTGFNFISFQPEIPSVSEINISALLRFNQNTLETVIFNKNSLKFIAPLPKSLQDGIVMKKLTRLEIFLTDDPTPTEKTIFRQLATIEMPRLTRLAAHFRFSLLDTAEQLDNLDFYLQVFQLIAKLKTTLKILHLTYDFILFPIPVQLPLVEGQGQGGHPIQSNNLKILKTKLKTNQLEELRIGFSRYEGYEPYTLGTLLLASQTTLSSIEAVILNEGSQHLYTRLGKCIETNKWTLKRIHVKNDCFFRQQRLPGAISHAIGLCGQLESLGLVGFEIPCPSLADLFRGQCQSQSQSQTRIRTENNESPANSIKRLELEGTLDANILLEVVLLSRLEHFTFWYNASVDTSHYSLLQRNLVQLLQMDAMTMATLTQVKLLVAGLDLDFLLDIPGIRVQGNRNGLHECTVIINRQRGD